MPSKKYLAYEILRHVAVTNGESWLVDAAVGEGDGDAAVNGWLPSRPIEGFRDCWKVQGTPRHRLAPVLQHAGRPQAHAGCHRVPWEFCGNV